MRNLTAGAPARARELARGDGVAALKQLAAAPDPACRRHAAALLRSCFDDVDAKAAVAASLNVDPDDLQGLEKAVETLCVSPGDRSPRGSLKRLLGACAQAAAPPGRRPSFNEPVRQRPAKVATAHSETLAAAPRALVAAAPLPPLTELSGYAPPRRRNSLSRLCSAQERRGPLESLILADGALDLTREEARAQMIRPAQAPPAERFRAWFESEFCGLHAVHVDAARRIAIVCFPTPHAREALEMMARRTERNGEDDRLRSHFLRRWNARYRRTAWT